MSQCLRCICSVTRVASLLFAVVSGLNTPSANQAVQLSGDAAFSYIVTLPNIAHSSADKSERAGKLPFQDVHRLSNQSRGGSSGSTIAPIAAIAPVHEARAQLGQHEQGIRMHLEAEKKQAQTDLNHIVGNDTQRYLVPLHDNALGSHIGFEAAASRQSSYLSFTAEARKGGRQNSAQSLIGWEDSLKAFMEGRIRDFRVIRIVGLGGGILFLLSTCALWKCQVIAMNGKVDARRALYKMIGPHSIRAPAKVFRRCLVCIVIFNVTMVILDSHPSNGNKLWFHFEVMEAVSSWIFLIEYCMRLYSIPESKSYKQTTDFWARLRWMFTFGAIVDLASILPYFFDHFYMMILPHEYIKCRAWTWLRVLRLFRILKISWVQESFDVFARVLYYNAEMLLLSFVLCVLLVIILSILLYYVQPEASSDASGADFSSIFQCAYLAIMMLTGQGSPEGELPWYTKAIVAVIAVFGVGLFAIQAAMLTWGFEFEAQHRIVKHKQQRKLQIKDILEGKVEENCSSSSADDEIDSDWERYEDCAAGSDVDEKDFVRKDDEEHDFFHESLEKMKHHFSFRQLASVRSILKLLDFSSDGTLSRCELDHIPDLNTCIFFSHYDADNNDSISFEEFLGWIVSVKQKHSHDVFKVFLDSLLAACKAGRHEAKDEAFKPHMQYIGKLVESFTRLQSENEVLKKDIQQLRAAQLKKNGGRRSINSMARKKLLEATHTLKSFSPRH